MSIRCPNCGYTYTPAGPAKPMKPGISRMCGNCGNVEEFVGPRRPQSWGHPPPLKCRVDGSDVAATCGCGGDFRPSQEAIKRFKRCGV